MSAESFPFLTPEGEVKYNRIDRTILEKLKLLPADHERYFMTGPTTQYLPVSKLVFSRARPEGIANANVLMEEAAVGNRSRRGPIRVRERGDGRWEVIDGNSTALNALFSGWSDIPADVDHS